MATSAFEHEVLLVCSSLDSFGLARFPKVLYKAGCRVTLLSPRGLVINHSRFVARHIVTTNDINASVLLLQEVLSAQSPPFAQVIIGDEPMLNQLAERRGEDWLDGWFPVDHRTKAVDILISKHAFYDEMVGAGLYMPFSKLCYGKVEIEESINAVGYPVILKSSSGYAGTAVRQLSDDSELESVYVDWGAIDGPIMVQQFCVGKLGATDVLFDHGVPVCWQSTYKPESWPTPLSPSSARILMYHPSIADIITVVGKVTGFHGFAAVDWIHETDSDRICLLEMNPRPTPSVHLKLHSGVDFSRSFSQLLAGQRIITSPKPILQSTRLVKMFPQGLFWAIDRGDVLGFIRCWHDAPWTDLKLFIFYLDRVLYYYLHKIGFFKN